MKDKIVAITGGSGTLGKAIVHGLATSGATVYCLDRNREKAAKNVAEFQQMGLKVETIFCDVTSEEITKNAVEELIQKEGRVDVLINGAGGNMPGATIRPDQSFFDIDIEQFKKVMDLNLIGTVIPTIACAKYMVKQGKGSIINISSMAAMLPISRVVGYSASKSAVNSFTQSMALELISKYGEGIRVNAIAPGFLIAEQNRTLLLNEDGSLTDRGKTIISQTPMKRFGKPEELVSTIEWLCDDRSSFITGIVVPIDGGFSAFSGV